MTTTEAKRESRDLTDRELQVLRAASYGWTNRKIAEGMHVAEDTVKSHMARIARVLKIRSRTGIVAYALRHGIIN